MESPRYTACLAYYYAPGLDPEEIVRTTIAIVDLRTDKLVDHREWWADDGLTEEELAEDAIEFAGRYAAKLHRVSGSVPLDKCKCGCAGYTVRTIHRRDLRRAKKGAA